MENTLAVGGCCCLQRCKSVVNLLIMGLAHSQSLVVICTTDILMQKYISPLYKYYIQECLCWVFTCNTKVHCLQTPECIL